MLKNQNLGVDPLAYADLILLCDGVLAGFGKGYAVLDLL